MFSILPRSWGISSTGMQMTYNSTITVLPVIQPSSPIGLLIASRSWVNLMAVQQPSQVKCIENGVHLAGLDSPPGTFDPIIIKGVTIQPSSTVCDLGAYIDSGMSYTDHVTRLMRTCFFHIRQLRSIRRSLTVDTSNALVRALILTRLDYCNGLFGGAPKCLLSPLSSVLRAAARLILLLPHTSSVENEIRTVLHWLDVPARVTFKLCLLVHRCLHGSAPSYLIRYFTSVSSIVGRSHLCSAITGTLFVLDRGRRQLDLGRSPSPLRLHGTVSRLIFVIPGSVFWLSDVDSRLIYLILLVIYLLSCPFDSYFSIVIVCELLASGFCDNFLKPNLIIVSIEVR